MQFVGIDWAYRRAAWCAKSRSGEVVAEGVTPADEDGLAKAGDCARSEVSACVKMMSGAVWVRVRLRAAGWVVEVAEASKVKAIAPLACKTDKVDAPVLAELCRRELCHSQLGDGELVRRAAPGADQAEFGTRALAPHWSAEALKDYEGLVQGVCRRAPLLGPPIQPPFREPRQAELEREPRRELEIDLVDRVNGLRHTPFGGDQDRARPGQ
jgi:hypothetical protein